MEIVRLSVSAFIIFCGATQLASAVCWVDDADFATEDGGCKDHATGLVWSPDWRGVTGNPYATAAFPPQYCEYRDYNGFSDWRHPTLGEIEETLANGLNEHLDFFLDGGATPDDNLYHATSCNTKVRGSRKYYVIRFSDGDVHLTNGAGEINPYVCVRGVDADPDNDCPGKKKGGGKGKNAMLLPRSATGAILLLPLCLVGIVCGARRRWR
jgi:hypothetical protein